MKIYYLAILKTNGDKSLELASARDLSSFSFFERNGVSQFMTFFATTVAGRTQPGQRQSVEEKESKLLINFFKGDIINILFVELS